MLETEPDDDETSSLLVPKSPDILIDTTNSLTLSEVYENLPPRHVADALLSAFFNSKHIQLRMSVARKLEAIR